jgi:hypothetical protein
MHKEQNCRLYFDLYFQRRGTHNKERESTISSQIATKPGTKPSLGFGCPK